MMAPKRFQPAGLQAGEEVRMHMQPIVSAVTILALLCTTVSAQTLDDLRNDGHNTDNILTYGMGYHQNRYRPLKQIDKRNVRKLVPAWSVSLASNLGEQGQPLVYNGVLYA